MSTVIRSFDTHLVESRRNFCALNPGNRLAASNTGTYTPGTTVSRTNNAVVPQSASGFGARFTVNANFMHIGPLPTMLNGARGVAGGMVTVVWKVTNVGAATGSTSVYTNAALTAEKIDASPAVPMVAGETRQFFATFQMTRNYTSADEIRTAAAFSAGERSFEAFEFDVYPGPYQPERAWFFGAGAAAGDRSYTWAGAADASESIEWLRVPVVSVQPLVVEGFEASRTPGTILHTVLGRPAPDVTFRPGGLRAGTLSLVMPDAVSAHAAQAGLLTPRVFELADTDVPELGMRFVVADDDITLTLDPVTRKRWLLKVPFREVSA